ncbi:BlaI/MecI/CopY family transcriptional regulator [Granulicella tundricola]|uniref:Transcriptional repressor, CopY family n=1 Tax=Granulicella tundricola (strain ATCC BAA-1859 / DSM 23138 / MP5ACTX9) TaxID=1198114 RepID=E8WZM2_GRATM|nr:BlaI/MecI/CopY family transcriptional regulator [Granulicella tundricola]ADW69996.1 transcriptional repressor, CopY family [Granulicella tundricola MP5ACTX9]
MPDDPQTNLTRLELRIMQALWTLGESNVASVQQALDPPLAYTTVQTMLNILERKGKLERRREGRAFLYNPVVTQARASGQGLRDLIDRMFDGSSEELVMSLLKNRQIDADRLTEITERFNAKADPDPTIAKKAKP